MSPRYPPLTLTAALAIAATGLGLIGNTVAVCSEYQIAVGIEYTSVADPGAPQAPYYSGFEMTNGCKLISQNGLSEDNNAVCNGDWFGGADVTCDDSGNPISAVDTSGKSYTCSGTEDTSCNVTSGLTSFQVVACCTAD